MSQLLDIIVAVWFVFVAINFFGAIFGFAPPPNLSLAIYAAFLLLAVVRLALALLKRTA